MTYPIINEIKSWITDYSIQNGKKSLIIAKDNQNAKLLFDICSEITGLKTYELPYDTTADQLVKKAEEVNGLILGGVDRTHGHLIRRYHKYKDNADIFPLLDLYASEIEPLLTHYSCHVMYEGNSILELSLADIEWADKENELLKIIENDVSPQQTETWYKYTLPQKRIIARIHQIEKQTRHKIITRPYLKFK
jgi:hypothetical protein